jgi:hypothetical protein
LKLFEHHACEDGGHFACVPSCVEIGVDDDIHITHIVTFPVPPKITPPNNVLEQKGTNFTVLCTVVWHWREFSNCLSLRTCPQRPHSLFTSARTIDHWHWHCETPWFEVESIMLLPLHKCMLEVEELGLGGFNRFGAISPPMSIHQ